METKGRSILHLAFSMRQPPRSDLLLIISTLLLCLLSAPAFLFSACTGTGEPSVSERKKDTALESDLEISSARYPLRSLELFIYDAGGTRNLERRVHITLDDSHSCNLSLFSTDGDKIAVALANCPFDVNEAAVPVMDAMENVTIQLGDDRPEAPFMSACTEFRAGEQCRMELRSLMCEVELTSITNWSGRAVTDISARLTEAVTYSEILLADGFRQNGNCADTLSSAQTVSVGVGGRSDTPLRVFCYPNDLEDTAGTPATNLLLCGTMNGKRIEYSTSLPPMRRQTRLRTAATILSARECIFEFF